MTHFSFNSWPILVKIAWKDRGSIGIQSTCPSRYMTVHLVIVQKGFSQTRVMPWWSKTVICRAFTKRGNQTSQPWSGALWTLVLHTFPWGKGRYHEDSACHIFVRVFLVVAIRGMIFPTRPSVVLRILRYLKLLNAPSRLPQGVNACKAPDS